MSSAAPSSHQAVHQALKRARWLHWLLVALILLLALGTLQNGGKVQSLRRRDAEMRRVLLLNELREARERGEDGWLNLARTNLLRAREIRADQDLRDEWVSCLAKAADQRSGDRLPCRLLPWPPMTRGPNLELRFTPGGGVLFGCTDRAWVEWRLDRPGQPPRTVPDAMRNLAGTMGIRTNSGGLKAVPRDDGGVQLRTEDQDRVVVTLRGPVAHRVFALAWSDGGTWLAMAGRSHHSVPGSDGRIVEVWNLPSLRRGLGELGLDWSDGNPAASLARAPEPERWFRRIRVTLGALLVLVVAAAAIVNQHVVFNRYQAAERSAAERAHELVQVRERMTHAEKMRALGTLAAGVAHDFNNLLSVIQMSRQLVERALRPAGVTKEHLDNIGQAVEQGRTVVRSILGYSRDTRDLTQRVNVTELVDGVMALLRGQFLSGVQTSVQVAPGLPEVEASRGRLEQLLLNLIVNAAEAMNGKGNLRLAARMVDLAGDCLRPAHGHGPWLELAVSDTGPGIPPEVQPRIFEPFFTTKTLGNQRGTGLGLATVWRIAEEEGLGLRLHSEMGRGTEFRVLVPLSKHASPDPVPIPDAHRP